MSAPVPLVERLAEALGRERDPDEHSPLCSDAEPCRYCMKLARALLPVVEQAVAEARGEALWQATNDWQWGQWTVLTEPIKAEAQPQRIIGAAQAVTDWLRDRAKASTKETP